MCVTCPHCGDTNEIADETARCPNCEYDLTIKKGSVTATSPHIHDRRGPLTGCQACAGDLEHERPGTSADWIEVVLCPDHQRVLFDALRAPLPPE